MANKIKTRTKIVSVNRFAVIGGIGSEQSRCVINIDIRECGDFVFNEAVDLYQYLVISHVNKSEEQAKRLTYFEYFHTAAEPLPNNTNPLNFAYVFSTKNLYK